MSVYTPPKEPRGRDWLLAALIAFICAMLVAAAFLSMEKADAQVNRAPTSTARDLRVPSIITQSDAWFSADSGAYSDVGGTTLITVDSTLVKSWRDQSANARLFVEKSSGGGPTWIAAGENSKPYVDFTGAQGLLFAGVTDFLNANAVTGFVVTASLSSTNPFFAQSVGAGDFDKWFLARDWFQYKDGGGSSETLTRVDGDSAFHLISFRKAANGVWSWEEDGATSASGTGAIALPTGNTGDLTIGYAEGTYFLNGDVYELVVFNSALSNAQRLTVSSHLNTKYAIY